MLPSVEIKVQVIYMCNMDVTLTQMEVMAVSLPRFFLLPTSCLIASKNVLGIQKFGHVTILYGLWYGIVN
jgi:hypothetical protein